MRQINQFNVAMTVSEVVSEIGCRIAERRLGLNWTQRELAEKSGLSLSTLVRLESGIGNPRLEALVAVCTAMNLTEGFESLLPAVRATPQEIVAGVKSRRRASKSNQAKTWKWGDEE